MVSRADPLRLLAVLQLHPERKGLPGAVAKHASFPQRHLQGESDRPHRRSTLHADRHLLQFKPTVILSGTHRNLHAAGGRQAYAQYVRYLHRKMGPLSPIEDYAQGYLDHLQTPLQPLMDNLESETYEGFEKDPIKYRQYEEAIHKALSDRPTMGTT